MSTKHTCVAVRLSRPRSAERDRSRSDHVARRIGNAFGLSALLAFGLSLLGCKQGPYNDLYNAKMGGEIRVLEDQLYECDFENRRLHQEIERLRLDQKQLEGKLEQANRVQTNSAPSSRGAQRPGTMRSAVPGMPIGPSDVAPGAPEPPRLDIEDLERPNEQSNPPSPPDGSAIIDGAVKQTYVEIPGQITPRAARLSGLPATEIVIESSRSSGWDFDSNAGDDGVRVTVSARDSHGEPTMFPADAPVELAIFDTAISDAAASQSLALKRYSQTDLHQQPWTADGSAVELKVPFDQDVPPGASVTVIVRCRMADEQWLTAEQTLRLRSTEEVASGWTAR